MYSLPTKPIKIFDFPGLPLELRNMVYGEILRSWPTHKVTRVFGKAINDQSVFCTCSANSTCCNMHGHGLQILRSSNKSTMNSATPPPPPKKKFNDIDVSIGGIVLAHDASRHGRDIKLTTELRGLSCSEGMY
jgi:hypothetical protein